jgi:hypothetical protein
MKEKKNLKKKKKNQSSANFVNFERMINKYNNEKLAFK